MKGHVLVVCVLISTVAGLVVTVDGKNLTASHCESRFGDQTYHNTTGHDVVGILAAADPINACSELKNNLTGKIALVERTKVPQCSFVDKVLFAQDAGAIGAVVFNHELTLFEKSLIVMSYPEGDTNHTKVFIPNIFIQRVDGLELLKLMNKSDIVGILNAEGMIPNYSLLDVFIYTLVAIALMIFPCLIIYAIREVPKKFIAHRRKIAANRLLPFEYSPPKYASSDDSCAVCLGPFNEGEVCKRLPCEHLFHQSCIDPWLRDQRALCPVCRRGIYESEDLNILEEGRFRDIDVLLDRYELIQSSQWLRVSCCLICALMIGNFIFAVFMI